MGHQGWNSDDRAADRTDNASPKQPHYKCAYKGEIGEAVVRADQAQGDADNERWRHEEHEFELLVGVALLGEEHLAKSPPARQQRGNRGGNAYLEQEREQ